MERTVFVTGGTGLIGKWLLAYLSSEGAKVYVLARNAQRRESHICQWVNARGGDAARLQFVEGDLTKPGLGISQGDKDLIKNCTHVYHMGAAYAWGLTREEAHQVTVGGSRALLDIAEQMSDLKQIIHLTGYMLAAPHIWALLGLDKNTWDDGRALNNSQLDALYAVFPAYEAAKIAAHFEVAHLAASKQLPLTNIELSTVAGHSESGEIDQPHGLELMIRGIWEGNMPVIPGSRRDWMPIVAVDFLARFITGISELPETIGNSYVLLDDRSPRMGEMIALVNERFGRTSPKVRLPVSMVRFFLNAGGEKMTGMSAEPLAFIQPYTYDTTETKAIARKLGLSLPDPKSVLLKTVDYWLGKQEGQHDHMPSGKFGYRRVAQTQTFVVSSDQGAENVFLHGLPFNGSMWKPLAASVQGARLIPDLPGVSRSSPLTGLKSRWMELLLSDSEGPFNIIAHSWGTAYALEYAALHPEKIKKLSLISPFFLQTSPPGFVNLPFVGLLAKFFISESRFAQNFLKDVIDSEQVHQAYLNTRAPDVMSNIFKVLRHARSSKVKAYYRELLAAIKVPTVVIHGENDPLLESVSATNLKTYCIAGASHNPQITHVNEVAAIIGSERIKADAKVKTGAGGNDGLQAKAFVGEHHNVGITLG
ncbi:MAG: alpha/beta fold hydrolase [Pseudomonadales bacterium]|nr:alpha/beta fold hydrolase [Pseudomonadales bacterium]